MAAKVFPGAGLKDFTARVFERAGLSRAHAATVADALVWANLRGHDSHGVLRIPRYVEWIDSGEIRKNPAMRVHDDAPAAVLLDADQAPGPVAMLEATSLAVGKARAAGIGLADRKSVV